jgi:hypothetical protein
VSRELFVNLEEGDVVARCLKEQVSISVIERIPSGGVRLVCSSSEGALHMRIKLKTRLITGDVVRARHRPNRPLW